MSYHSIVGTFDQSNIPNIRMSFTVKQTITEIHRKSQGKSCKKSSVQSSAWREHSMYLYYFRHISF